ncbi:MAG: DNA/RNA nuclease SfsA [Pseudomonadales bacterium]
MIFEPPLAEARLVERYKRFLADAELQDGRVVTLHCPNTGSMLGCAKPGSRIWYWASSNPRRKYPLTWELVALDDGALVGINTLRANRLVKEALTSHRLAALSGYEEVRTEVAVDGSRIDFRLGAPGLPDCFVEVKSVTLSTGNGLGLFPDAPSVRARRHLETLCDLASQGFRAVLLYCAQHTAIRRVAPAKQIDPAYAEALLRAVGSGVEVLACGVSVDLERIEIACELPVVPP